jgi:uncharacterized protein
MIVSDAGPIITFARIARLSLLREVTGSVTIPAAVHAEISIIGMPGAAELAEVEWIQRAVVTDRSQLAALPRALHAGEREAIGTCQRTRRATPDGRNSGPRAAAQLRIEIIGTLRILADAKRLGHIEVVRPIILEMQSSGYRFDRTLIRRFLEQMGEG